MSTTKRFDTASAEARAMYAILGGIVVVALAAAFTHMHDWTDKATDMHDWFGWANAVISELLPTASFLAIRRRLREKRSIGYPAFLFAASAALSITAQLSATGVRIPYDEQLLVCLPALAVLALSKLVFADIEYDRRLAAERAAADARSAERAARQRAAERAEAERLAAERAADEHARAAELAAAEVARAEARAAEATALADARAAELAAEQAAAERARAEAERIEAERRADADRAALAERTREIERRAADRRERELRREQAEQAAQLAAAAAGGVGRVDQADEQGSGAPVPAQGGAEARRRSRGQTALLVQAILDTLPEGTTRDQAVKAVAEQLDMSERGARNYVPADWPDTRTVAPQGAERTGEYPLVVPRNEARNEPATAGS